jgi:hypothetical protein
MQNGIGTIYYALSLGNYMMMNCKKDIFNKTMPQHTLVSLLHEIFDDRLVNFPPRSPDLTILDYFVFPYLKNNVFKNKPGTIPELMQAITDIVCPARRLGDISH